SPKRHRFVEPSGRAREEEAQAQASCSISQFLLHEQPYLATLKLWWCVGTARRFYASRPAVELDSLRAALSGKRVTKSDPAATIRG
ncbi:hypothetical protein Gorai_020892, partial [Gossypium raimondii]|nr:hypothetical protein [Gossypium raimondii]